MRWLTLIVGLADNVSLRHFDSAQLVHSALLFVFMLLTLLLSAHFIVAIRRMKDQADIAIIDFGEFLNRNEEQKKEIARQMDDAFSGCRFREFGGSRCWQSYGVRVLPMGAFYESLIQVYSYTRYYSKAWSALAHCTKILVLYLLGSKSRYATSPVSAHCYRLLLLHAICYRRGRHLH